MLKDMEWTRVYIDNIVILSVLDYTLHARRMVLVIQRLTKYLVWLNIPRCKIMRRELVVMGHHVSEEGIRLDPGKVAAVSSWSRPQTEADLQRFIGFVNFLRPNIRHFSELLAPLNELKGALQRVASRQAAELGKSPGKNTGRAALRWTGRHQVAFDLIKQAVASAPLLLFPDLAKPFALAIDASTVGIGGVLYQPRLMSDLPTAATVVSFTSRSLAKHEKNYSVYKLECLALVYCLSVFDQYLYGAEFTVHTDHRALIYLLEQKLNTVLNNWLTLILEYRFTIVHVSGEINTGADFLSRAYSPAGVWGVTRYTQMGTLAHHRKT
jgi:hypothetical protein